MSDFKPSQKRNPQQLKPTSVSATGDYSASPSQLTLSSAASTGFHNPYQPQYTYAPSSHQQFGFPPQQVQYPHQLQTQPLGQQQHQQQSQQGVSPTNSRKRRASELGGGETVLSAGSSSSSYTNAPTAGFGAGFSSGEAIDPGGGQGPSQGQLQSPVAKKGRTNTPWTPAEEQRLKTMRDAGSSWSEIAKTFPQRTEGSVKKHWYKDMHYAEFAEDEVSNFSAALLQAIKDYENNKWKVIGQKVGKPAKACEQFAKEQGWKV